MYLEGFGDSGLGGLVDLSLPDTPAAALPKLTQTEAQILLVGIVFNLQQHIRNSASSLTAYASLSRNSLMAYNIGLCAN